MTAPAPRVGRAPGKIVLSGAYSVLEGAPAIVASVDRYVTADASRPGDRVTAEVAAAIAAGALAAAPWFDAAPLRDGERKLGLGSSAAILVASMAAAIGTRGDDDDDEALSAAIFAPALAAHRAAQRGGSGIDVAASVRGGVLVCRLDGAGALETGKHALPPGAAVAVFSSPIASSTRDLLARVRAFEARDPGRYAKVVGRARAGAEEAALAGAIEPLVRWIRDQFEALADLGAAAGAAIVTADVASLAAQAAREGAAFGPSGAGGGDVAIFVGPAPPSAAFLEAARASALEELALRVDVRGVHTAAREG